MLAYARNEINRTRTTLSKTKPSSEQPRESARGSQPSRTPVTRGGAGEQSAPHPCRRKQCPQKNSLLRRKPKSPSEQPRESARGCEPSRLPIEADDLRGGKVACPKGKQESLCDRPSEIEDFGWSPRVLIFSERGLAPPEKKSLPCRSRARKSAGFQRNLRKGGVEGNPSPPRPRVSSRGPQSSRISIKSISAGNHILFRGGGSGGGACSPIHLTRARAL